MFVHLAVRLLFTRLSSGVAADQSRSRKERELYTGKIARVAGGFTSGGVAQFNARARWLKTRSRCLTDPVAGQFTVEGLIANTLLDRPKNLMLFHPRD